MTRFVYIADTHIGANPMGYQQQRGYPKRLDEILSALRDYISRSGDIDFILHGGDIVDAATRENIALATCFCDLPVPVYLCLGNHDVTTQGAVGQWLKCAPSFFVDGDINYTINTDDCLVHVVPTQWCKRANYWSGDQAPHLLSSQEQYLSCVLRRQPDLPHILLTHSPVYGPPAGQTGMQAPYHAPPVPFTSQMETIVREHASLRCVLGAHTHMNMRIARGNVEFVTVSALIETPFEFKLFEVTRQSINMSTVALAPIVTFANDYDNAKAYVQGRAADRSFRRS